MGVAGPTVTVVIPFYNDSYVTEAVDSALAQTYDDIEIIVVDDGSTRHADLLERYGSRIHYLGKANGGTASALNYGFRLASGQYVAWLSSDDRFYPEKIARQVQAMERSGSWISHTGFDLIDEGGRIAEKGIAPPPAGPEFYRAFHAANPVNGCTVMMRKLLYNQIGEFDERLRYTHDLDYWYRVMLAGFPFLLLPEPLTAYRWHAGMGTVLHKEAISREIRQTQTTYASRWSAFTSHLIGR
ncbi:glycosyltransferase [Paenibacillus methanolicus]|uniref:GT2 family glycosyltransferase n=1 Tax=Paenibacillus methanolicus TaxID=582686 RepID=A0A5S5BS87_9BACL|nr:glycosyltransferase [Paenibacillus methanolicus]TYP69857.1 GT2 family glycosyltransferase [Paenibacillus methanolicus]